MSSITSYKTTAFKESQKFLVIDPSTQSPSLVLGSDLVSYITPMLNYVRADSTRLSAENTDYDVGTLVQTSGATSPGDNFAATYLVVEGGSGDFPMLNGNDLLVIKGDEFLREQLISSDAGEGSDLVAHTGTSDTVTEALDKRTIYVGSVAELEALSLSEGTNVYLTDDQGYGEGIVKAGTPPSDPEKAIYVVLANGNYWQRLNASTGRIQSRWFRLLGDGSDELTKLRNLADYATDSKRGVDFEEGKTYKFSDYVSFFDAGVLDFKESLVVFEHSGNSTGLQLKGQTGIINSRHQNNGTPSGTLGPAGQRDIVALDVKHTQFKNITFVSGTNDYAPFNILGNSYDLDVENVEFEDGDWDMGCIIHWATASDSAATDYAEDIAFSPGVGNDTTHPHNIRVGNLKGGTYTVAGALVSQLFISGCYDITGENIWADEVNRILTVIAGDYGIAFAPTMISRFVGSGIVITNPSCNQITGSEGIQISGKGDLTANVLDMGVTIINPQIRKTLAATSYGIRVDNVSDVSVIGGRILGFSRSIFGQRNVKGFSASWTTCTESTVGGVLFDSDDETNTNIRLSFLKVFDNNSSASAALSASGITIRNTDGAVISGCQFGTVGGGEAQQHAVYVEDGCDNITLANNHTYSSAQTSAYSGELVTQYSMNLWDGGGNSADTAFSFRPDAHVWYQPLGFGNKSAYINSNNAVPASGTWSAGDEVIFRTPAPSGYRGALCTTGGTPGTWKRWGQLEA